MVAQTDTQRHQELGLFVADHRPNYAYTARRALGGALFAFAGAAVVLVGLKVIPFPHREGFWETVSVFVLGGILLASGLFFAVEAIRTTGPRVLVYEGGFLAGRHMFPWDRVETFHQLAAELDISGLPLSLTEYTIRRDDGRVIRFTRGVCRAGALAALVQERIQPRLLAKARALLAAGKEVDFGDVQLGADGLKFSDVMRGQVRKVAWHELRGVEAGGMQIHIRTASESALARWTGSGASIATRNVANVAVFLALVAEVLASRESAGIPREATPGQPL